MLNINNKNTRRTFAGNILQTYFDICSMCALLKALKVINVCKVIKLALIFDIRLFFI